MKHNWLRIICIAVAVVCLLAAFAIPVAAAPTRPTMPTPTMPPTKALPTTRPTWSGGTTIASTLSEGNWWIIGIGTAVIVVVLVAVVVIWKKRK